MARVQLQNVEKTFNKNKVLKGIDVEVPDGSFMVMVGPSGCGKSTALRCIAGLEDVTGGRILIGDEDVTRKEPKDRNIAMVFQNYALYPHMNVFDNITYGLKVRGIPAEERKRRAEEAARLLGLDGLLERMPKQLSGGQRQRVAIARALVVRPKFIVCDECVSALDVSIQSQIINLLQELKERQNLTYMFISHDLSVVRYISDRICVMYLGNIVELADAETIFQDPRHPYTVALLSSIPTTDPGSLEKERILLEGNIPSPIRPPAGCKFHTRCYMACDKCKRVPPPLREIEPGHFLACHFPQPKLDAEGNYLFELPKMERRSSRGSSEPAE